LGYAESSAIGVIVKQHHLRRFKNILYGFCASAAAPPYEAEPFSLGAKNCFH
jgi:hypothetical protein